MGLREFFLQRRIKGAEARMKSLRKRQKTMRKKLDELEERRKAGRIEKDAFEREHRRLEARLKGFTDEIHALAEEERAAREELAETTRA